MVTNSFAQQLALQGKIIFERKENMHKMLDDEGSWGQDMKKRLPKYRIDLMQLEFNKDKSKYSILQEEENALLSGFWRVAYNNQVLMNFTTRKFQSEKAVYDRNYHIEDSIPELTWKLTGEYREIAGYECRKATTIIMDSLYVIAFYTDKIPISGGPEIFQGLPGMILGIVIPRINYTYFATKVETTVIDDKTFKLQPLKKAKVVDRTNLLKEVEEAVNDWGKWGRKIYWRVVL